MPRFDGGKFGVKLSGRRVYFSNHVLNFYKDTVSPTMAKKCIWSALFLLFSSVLFRAQAQTIQASSCSESAVASALKSINSDGAVVVVPSGDCVWSTSLTYNQTNSFTLQGAGAITPAGGSDSTIIEDAVSHAGSDPPMLQINLVSGKSFRLTGFSFTTSSGNTGTPTYNGAVRIEGTSNAARIDHNHFNKIYLVDLNFQGCVNGVVDHNQFDGGYAEENQERFGSGSCNGDSSGNGNGSWAAPSNFGTSQFMYVENNGFQTVPSSASLHVYPFDCNAGGRFVFRYNKVGYHAVLQTHGTGGEFDIRGCRAYEVYNNTFTYSSNPTSDNFSMLGMLESGTSLWWGNTVTGFVSMLEADVVRANNTTYRMAATPSGWGYCGTTFGPSNWDQNASSNGHACLDSVGYGQGDLLTGTLPNKVDSVTHGITWPHQKSEPVYVFANTYNPVPQESGDTLWKNYPAPAVVSENKDYYLQLPNYSESASFNGTVGVGQGPYASMPSTCTPYVGYWATDKGTWNKSGTGGQGELYVCTAPNTWTLYYTPYTYPNPLTGSSTGPTLTPPAPSGLSGTLVTH